MKKYWYESQPGRISAIRVMAVPGFFISIAAAVVSTGFALFDSRPGLVTLVITWLAFAGGCITGKTFQKRREINKES